jgi:DNA-binding GntR family transcriptional regulator
MKTIDGTAPTHAVSLRLPPLRRRIGETTGEYVHRRLRLAIMVGRFPPGAAVTIRGLAALLGTSAMPVREAMRRLVTEHALDLLDNRRALVPNMTNRRFLNLIDTRILLETAAAARALPIIDRPRLLELRHLDQVTRDAASRGMIDRTIDANLAFHRRLYSYAPDDVLTPLIESVWLQIGPCMRAMTRGAREYFSMGQHIDALDAIAAQDAASLTRAIELDIRAGIGDLISSGAFGPAR